MITNQASFQRLGVPLYQLRLTVKWSKPPIWRRVIVRSDMTLDRLHSVIQIAMGWFNCHMHQYLSGAGFRRTYYGRPDPQYSDLSNPMLNEKHYSIAGLAPLVRRKIIYEYDFGDGWQHDVLVEKILPPDASFEHPVCLAGENACPPEDCGGIYGYYKLLKILADPQHPEHEGMKGWIGGLWDAERFGLEGINARLRQLKA